MVHLPGNEFCLWRNYAKGQPGNHRLAIQGHCRWCYYCFVLSIHQISECPENNQGENHLEYRHTSIHVARKLPVQLRLRKLEVISSLFLVLPGKHNQQLSAPVNPFAENVQVALDTRFYFPKRWHGPVTPQSCAEVGDFLGLLFHSSILPSPLEIYPFPFSLLPSFVALPPLFDQLWLLSGPCKSL